MRKIVIIVLAMVAMVGCSKLSYDNGTDTPTEETTQRDTTSAPKKGINVIKIHVKDPIIWA